MNRIGQDQSGEHPSGARARRIAGWKGHVVATALLLLTWHDPVAVAAPPDTVTTGEPQAPQQLRQARDEWLKAERASAVLADRVRRLSWFLLMGEWAADRGVGLSSNAFDVLSGGLDGLSSLANDLQTSPDLERELVADPFLAMRFDLVAARREELANKRDLSRRDELARLSQLRQLNATYRNLLQQILSAQTGTLTGQTDLAVLAGQTAISQFEQAEAIVGARRDYYLFQDEPALVDPATAELPLARQLAAPFDVSVIRHQHALNALWLCRQARQLEGAAQASVLERALRSVDAARSSEGDAGIVASYAEGVVCDALGRLKTAANPLSASTHADAEPLFARSAQALTIALKQLEQSGAESELLADTRKLVEDALGDESSLRRAAEELALGDSKAALSTLTRGLHRHRSGRLALRAAELQWRTGALQGEALTAAFDQITAQGGLPEIDPDLVETRRRVQVIETWKALTQRAEGQAENRSARSAHLAQAVADWPVDGSRDEHSYWISAAHRSLAIATLFLVNPAKHTAAARAALMDSPEVVAELSRRSQDASLADSSTLREAESIARIAEGHFTLGLVSDGSERARWAFAAAADLDARQPPLAIRLSTSGSTVMNALLAGDQESRAGSTNRERTLRIAAQKMVPAVIAMNLGAPEEVADVLISVRREVRAGGHQFSAEQQLDPRDVGGAAEGLLADSLASTAIALTRADRASEAVACLLEELWPELERPADLTLVDWAVVSDRVVAVADPLVIHALAYALEQYAVEGLPEGHGASRAILQAALAANRAAQTVWSQNIVWRRRWPHLNPLLEEGIARLVSDAAALETVAQLRSELRLNEARQVLGQALRRHPDSVAVRDEFVRALVDESQVSPLQKRELLETALSQLTRQQSEPVARTLLRAELCDRLGRHAEALTEYRTVVAMTAPGDEVDRAASVRARSRIVSLGLTGTRSVAER